MKKKFGTGRVLGSHQALETGYLGEFCNEIEWMREFHPKFGPAGAAVKIMAKLY